MGRIFMPFTDDFSHVRHIVTLSHCHNKGVVSAQRGHCVYIFNYLYIYNIILTLFIIIRINIQF